MRMKTPELSLWSRILYTTRITQSPSFPPVQYINPIPPCVRMSPSSTVISPGPTCFHPTRSLPSKSCFHSLDWAKAIFAERKIRAINRAVRTIHLDPAKYSAHEIFAVRRDYSSSFPRAHEPKERLAQIDSLG